MEGCPERDRGHHATLSRPTVPSLNRCGFPTSTEALQVRNGVGEISGRTLEAHAERRQTLAPPYFELLFKITDSA